MLIRSKLFRPGGTRVELGKGKDVRRYHFKPLSPTGPEDKFDSPEIDHVTDVTDPKDVATLLAIPEGYEILESELKKPAAAAAAKAADKVAETAAAAAKPAPATPTSYSNLKKPDLIKRIVGHPKFTGKAPHGTTPIAKLIAQLEKLDATA